MADPTGLVALGLGGAGRLLKIRSAIAHRKETIAQLAERVDTAHALLLSESAGEYSAIYAEILAPHIAESVALLETINGRDRKQAFKYSVVLPSRDAAEASRLIQAFDQAPKDIELRCIHQTVKILVVTQSNATIPTRRGTDIRTMHVLIITFAYFLSSGETSVTPLCIERTRFQQYSTFPS